MCDISNCTFKPLANSQVSIHTLNKQGKKVYKAFSLYQNGEYSKLGMSLDAVVYKTQLDTHLTTFIVEN